MKKYRITAILAALCLCITACGQADTAQDSGQTAQEPQQEAAGQEDAQAEDAGTVATETASQEAGSSEADTAVTDAADSSAAQAEAQAAEEEEMQLVETVHKLHTQEEADYYGTTFAYIEGAYSELHLSEDSAVKWPGLEAALTDLNDRLSGYCLSEVYYDLDYAMSLGSNRISASYEVLEGMVVHRADEAMVCLQVPFTTYNGGAHPASWEYSFAFDTATGEAIPFCDIINGSDNLKAMPQMLLDHLTAEAVTDYVFSDEENAEMLPVLESKVEYNDLVWVIDGSDLIIYFAAEELRGYAFGPITAKISLLDHPDLIVEKYRPVEGITYAGDRVLQEEAPEEVYSYDDLAEMFGDVPGGEEYADGDDAGIHIVECPAWTMDTYTSPDCQEGGLMHSPFDFEECSRTDLTSAEDWAAEKGVELPHTLEAGIAPPYQYWVNDDGTYYYMADNYNGGDNLILEVSKSETYDAVGTFFFDNYLYTTTAVVPKAKNNSGGGGGGGGGGGHGGGGGGF